MSLHERSVMSGELRHYNLTATMPCRIPECVSSRLCVVRRGIMPHTYSSPNVSKTKDNARRHANPFPKPCTSFSSGDCHTTTSTHADPISSTTASSRAPHEFASISAHFSSIFALFTFACSRFSFVLFSRSARRHMLTLCFAVVHMPIDFQRNPRAWHSSSAVMTSSQSGM